MSKKTTKRATGKTETNGTRWKRLRDWPNYEVSEAGEIRNRATKKVRALTHVGKNRCAWVSLQRTDDGVHVRKTERLDRLIAEAFVGRPTKRKPVLRHVDGRKWNCAASNLEYRSM